MTLHSVSLQDVRTHELHIATLNPQVTLIVGRNGSGKTTLLEAIYFLYRGTSFRGSDRDMIRSGAATGALKLSHTSGERRARLSTTPEAKLAKEFTVHDKKSARLPAAERLPVVLFEPDELRVLTSSPSRRRDFVDSLIARLKPAYAIVVNRYARTLLQRNELLKQREFMESHAWDAHLFAWDVKFAELASVIVRERRAFFDVCNEHLSRLYSQLADSDHLVRASYDSTIPVEHYRQNLINQLHGQRRSDALRGFTSVGPHRDDFTSLLDERPASETASRGEMRTIMLAFKLLEVELQQKATGEPPLILMDDVFSELDIVRERKLMQALSNFQTIVTATDLRDDLTIAATVIEL